MSFRLLLSAVLLLPLASCANCGGDDDTERDGGDNADVLRFGDGGTLRPVDGAVLGPDGEIIRSSAPCGAGGDRCCRGNACNLGLRCGPGNKCCSRPGGPACTGPEDCCAGFVCEDSKCLTPEGSTCIGSSDCATDLACLGGVCTEPTEACGAMGGDCCTGDVCRSGNACMGTMCVTCGASGQPCCDGVGACGSSGALLCLGGMCDAPDGCGSTGMPCCEDEQCIRGSRCNSAMDMCEEAPAPGSEGSECGGDGQRCCPGDVCQLGSICEPFLTNMCVGLMTIQNLLGDCGQDGQLCCLPTFQCEGDLRCDFLRCSGSCSDLSEDCTPGPTDNCCGDSVCLPGPQGVRCCGGDGEDCVNDLDCCGFTECDDTSNTCSCRAQGSTCVTKEECCNDGECILGMCEPTGACNAVQEECAAPTDCCTGLACETIAFTDDTPDEVYCCIQAEGACTEALDCCGAMLCEGGVCACQTVAEKCVTDDECCGETICVAGECAENTGSCGRIMEACDSGDSEACCGIAQCKPAGSQTGPDQCCARVTDRCSDSFECCGAMTCGGNNTCECVPDGMPCATGDCCGTSVCNDTMAGTQNGTCGAP